MRRTALSLIAAGALLLAGCASQEAGTPTAGSGAEQTTSSAATTPSSSSESSASSESAESSASSASSAESSASTQSSAESSQSSEESSQSSSAESSSGTDGTTATGAAELDDASLTWVTSFCTGFSNVAKFTSPDTTGMDKDATIAAVVDAYQGMSDAAAGAAAELEGIPAPTFAGGEQMATGVHDWFEDVAKAYGDGADTIKNGSYSTASDLKDDIDAIESSIDTANQKLSSTLGGVDPSVGQAIAGVPECATLASGG